MIGRTNSGGSRIFSVIAVTYPEGSLCSCTKGTRTLKAKDRSGKALFNVPEAGDWLIECQTEDGSKKKSRSVKISEAHESFAVVLTYELVLFDGSAGGDNTAITGGWEGNKGSILSVTSSIDRGAAIATKRKIDMKGYKTLYFNVCGYDYHGNTNQTPGGASSTNEAKNDFVAQCDVTKIGRYAIDIESISGEYYPKILVAGWSFNGNSYYGTVSVDRVWLE